MKKLKHYLFSLLFSVTVGSVIAAPAATPPENAVQTAPASTANLHMVNINTASAAEIQDKLTGIGAKKAQAIVEWREKHGQFTSIEQLTEVSGIGPATVDKNRDRIVLE